MNIISNKKVKNATITEVDGIKFKSKIEAFTYTKLVENDIIFSYEGETFCLLPSFKYDTRTTRSVTYTPDFIGKDFVIECKGFATDSFKLKWKLFLSYLRINNLEYKTYLVHNQKEVLMAIQNIKENESTTHN